MKLLDIGKQLLRLPQRFLDLNRIPQICVMAVELGDCIKFQVSMGIE